MKINVKILQGAECNVDVVAEDSVDKLKELVKDQLSISPSHQRLVHKGKTLQDGTLIQAYNLKHDDQINLVLQKEASPADAVAVAPFSAPAAEAIETQTELERRVLLEREMTRILKGHYSSDSEVRKVVSAFVKNIEKKLNALSLDDIERICERWNNSQVIQF